MATLPREIYIKQRKRRRDDEGDAPTYLQIDDDDPISKRRMSANFVYQRRNVKDQSLPTQPIPTYTPPPELAPPIIRTEPAKKPTATATSTPSHVPPPAHIPKGEESPPLSATGLRPPTRPGFQPRHFHMSRASMAAAAGTQSPSSGPQGVSKRSRYGTAVFIERGVKKLKSATDTARRVPVDIEPTTASGLKRPSTRRLKAPSPKPAEDTAEIAAQRKPLPQVTPDADVTKLASDMDQWVLHEIGLNLKEMSQPPPTPSRPTKPSAATPGSTSKFKPKAPAQRFAERHPALAAQLDRQNNGGQDTSMRDGSDSDDTSDEDYEIVVYELARNDGTGPALALGAIPPEEIGVLRFDSREDMELFYGNDEEDSDWVPEDDEDENAENHYTAEYPEELDSDDSEFDGKARGGIRDLSDDDDDDRVAAYYRPGMREYAGDYDSDDEDRYIVEGDDESRDPDEIHQEQIRRYIRRHGGS